MAKQKTGVNKSEQIRQVLKSNPNMPVKEVISTLAAKGINVAEGLVYFNKGRVKGRKGRRKKIGQMVEKVAVTTGDGDAVKTILKVKSWANEVGGLKKLKALVDALSE